MADWQPPAESAKLADIHLVFVCGPIRVIRVIRGCLKVFSPKLLSPLGEYDQSPRGFPDLKIRDAPRCPIPLQTAATDENARLFAPGSWLNGELLAEKKTAQNKDAAQSQFAACVAKNGTVFRKICGVSRHVGTSNTRNYENGSATEEPRIARHGGQSVVPPNNFPDRPLLRPLGQSSLINP